ncbi:ABC transporter permease [Gordonia sp. DT30]|uniref:ABC transporter permease n=1 Tax=Gordonia sp. DT30 TaxID=3416546 RepID=UPI003CF4007C
MSIIGTAPQPMTTATTDLPVTRGRHRRIAGRILRTVLPPAVILVVVVAVWQLCTILFDIPDYLVPSPSDLVHELGPALPGLVQPTLVTMQEAYGGFVIAAVAGFVAAVVMSRWSFAERGMYPYLVLLQTIPIIAVAPILVVWLGAGIATNTIVAAIIAVFPVAANTLTGLKSTERNLVQLFEMAGANKTHQLIVLRVPFALPYILTGLRIAAGSAVVGAIVGEFVAGIGGGEGGLGYVITSTAQQLMTSRLFLAVIAASLVSLLLFGIIRAIEAVTLRRWHESAMSSEE